MTDCQGKPLVPLPLEIPHGGSVVQCCFCGRRREFSTGKGRWVKFDPTNLEEQIDGWVVCPRCR